MTAEAKGIFGNEDCLFWISHWLTTCRVPTLITVKYVKHGEHLTQDLVAMGWNALFLQGSSPVEERKDLLGELAKGDLEVIVSTPILGEGIDEPRIGQVINAGGGKSAIRLIQEVGRGRRMSEGKGRLQFRDFFYDIHHPILKSHSKSRMSILDSEGFVFDQSPGMVWPRRKTKGRRR